MSSIVSNTSPLIVLAKAGLIDLLPRLFPEVIIPQAVHDEIQAGPPDDPMRAALPGCGWLRVVRLDPPSIAFGRDAVGPGRGRSNRVRPSPE